MAEEKNELVNAPFQRVFHIGTSGLVEMMIRFLTGREFFDLRAASTNEKNTLDKINWAILIVLHIGPDHAFLKKDDETYKQAYIRHMGVIPNFGRIYCAADMYARLTATPSYHFRTSVSNADFARVICGSYQLGCVAQRYPAHAEAAVKRVLDNPIVFARVIDSFHELKSFAQLFPDHAEAAVKRVLGNPTVFDRVFHGAYELYRFAERFPAHADAAVERFLDNPTVFARVIDGRGQLDRFTQRYPAHAEAAAKRVLDNPIVFARVFQNQQEVEEYFAQYVPAHTCEAEVAAALLLQLPNKKKVMTGTGSQLALLGAINEGQLQTVQELLKAGTGDFRWANWETNKGETTLHFAVRCAVNKNNGDDKDRERIVAALIENGGFNLTAINAKGQTPLDLAKHFKHVDLIACIEAGISAEDTREVGRSIAKQPNHFELTTFSSNVAASKTLSVFNEMQRHIRASIGVNPALQQAVAQHEGHEALRPDSLVRGTRVSK